MRLLATLSYVILLVGAATLPQIKTTDQGVQSQLVYSGSSQDSGRYCGQYFSDDGSGGTVVGILSYFKGVQKDCKPINFQAWDYSWVVVELHFCRTCHLYE